MKSQSGKQKGRRLQQWVKSLLIETFKLKEDDVQSRSMGANGEDVMLSPAARHCFPYSIECKNVERLNTWDAYQQACNNAGAHEPLLIIKKNHREPLAVVDAKHFIGVINVKAVDESV